MSYLIVIVITSIKKKKNRRMLNSQFFVQRFVFIPFIFICSARNESKCLSSAYTLRIRKKMFSDTFCKYLYYKHFNKDLYSVHIFEVKHTTILDEKKNPSETFYLRLLNVP